MYDFHVGQKVVCVDDAVVRSGYASDFFRKRYGLLKGNVYTVRWAGQFHFSDETPPRTTLGIKLDGIQRQYTADNTTDHPFGASRFKPLEEKPDAIEVFRQIARDVTAGKVRKLVGA